MHCSHQIFLATISLLAFGAFTGCGDDAVTRGRDGFTDTEARATVLTHYKSKGDHKNYDVDSARMESIGATYKIVGVSVLGVSPPWKEGWVVGKNAFLVMISVDALTSAFTEGYPPATNEEERDLLINKFLYCLGFDSASAAKTGKIIESIADIPHYEKSKLDPKLEATIRAPSSLDSATRVLYTYNRIGGTVSRFEFQFDVAGLLESVERTELGKDIGDALYLE